MVRAAAKNHPQRGRRRRPRVVRRGAGRGGRRAASTLAARRRLAARGVRAHRGLRHGGRRLVRSRSSPRDPRGGRRTPGCAPGAGRRAALRREPAPAGRALRRPAAAAGHRAGATSCTARRCPTTTTSTPTRRCGPRSTSTEPAVAIIKHANPCGIAVGADVADGAPAGARLRPGVGVRRRHRGQPRRSPWRWPSRSPRCSPRWSWRRRSTTDAFELLHAGRRTSGCSSCPTGTGATRGAAPGLRRACWCRPRDRVDAAGRRPVDLDAGRRRAGRRRRAAPTSRSPGGPAAR